MSIADDAGAPRKRRSSDHDEALTQGLINLFREEMRKDRHALREEFTLLANDLRLDFANTTRMVQSGNLAQVTENARMQAKLEEISTDISELRRLEPRVSRLEANDHATDRLGEFRRTLWRAVATVSALVVAMGGVIVAVASH